MGSGAKVQRARRSNRLSLEPRSYPNLVETAAAAQSDRERQLLVRAADYLMQGSRKADLTKDFLYSYVVAYHTIIIHIDARL